MTIKEIEERTGLPRANIRYYESQGLIAPARGDNGYRDYAQADIDTLLKIKLLRQLGFSLEEVHDIQVGRLELNRALEQREQSLEQEQLELGQAARLCRDMHGDRVRYDTLDAQRYLDQLAQGEGGAVQAAALEQDQIPRKLFPWRRYFARSFDMMLCSTLFTLTIQLLFRENLLLLSDCVPYKILSTAAALILMLISETLMLHFRGTTPGKALFGLRIVRQDGSFLSLSESFYRTALVVCFFTFCQIPLISTALLLYYCYCVYKDKPIPWESEEQVYLEGSDRDTPYWSKWSSWLKLGGYALSWGLCIGLLVLGQMSALSLAPQYPGPGMTAEQFVDNYNHFSDFLLGEDNVACYLTANGTFERVEHPGTYIPLNDSFPSPTVSFTEEDGVLTAVTISRSFHSSTPANSNSFSVATVPYDQMALATYAFLSGRPGIHILRLSTLIHDFSDARESFQYHLPGASIQCDMDFRGYVPGQDYLFPVDGREQSYQFCFTISLTQ